MESELLTPLAIHDDEYLETPSFMYSVGSVSPSQLSDVSTCSNSAEPPRIDLHQELFERSTVESAGGSDISDCSPVLVNIDAILHPSPHQTPVPTPSDRGSSALSPMQSQRSPLTHAVHSPYSSSAVRVRNATIFSSSLFSPQGASASNDPKSNISALLVTNSTHSNKSVKSEEEGEEVIYGDKKQANRQDSQFHFEDEKEISKMLLFAMQEDKDAAEQSKVSSYHGIVFTVLCSALLLIICLFTALHLWDNNKQVPFSFADSPFNETINHDSLDIIANTAAATDNYVSAEDSPALNEVDCNGYLEDTTELSLPSTDSLVTGPPNAGSPPRLLVAKLISSQLQPLVFLFSLSSQLLKNVLCIAARPFFLFGSGSMKMVQRISRLLKNPGKKSFNNHTVSIA